YRAPCPMSRRRRRQPKTPGARTLELAKPVTLLWLAGALSASGHFRSCTLADFGAGDAEADPVGRGGGQRPAAPHADERAHRFKPQIAGQACGSRIRVDRID